MITLKELRLRAEEAYLRFDEANTFYIYRSDTNAVLARGISGYDNAKEKANQLRRAHKLSWDTVKFKMEKKFGYSDNGKKYTNTAGQTGRVEYSARYNPSKRGRFRGVWMPDGTYADID